MLRYLTIGAFCVFGKAGSAAPMNHLDLVLNLEKSGFADVSIFDDSDALVSAFDYLEAADDPWGITKPSNLFSIGQMVPLTATFDPFGGELSDCDLGGLSCKWSFGQLDSDTFTFGDGAGFTDFGDFFIEGGVNIGDEVSLVTFEGAPSFESRPGEGYVFWDRYVQTFTVSQNNLVPVPLPASVLFLAAGIFSFGALRRRAAKLS